MGVEPNTVNDKMLYTPIDLHVLETFAIHGNLDVSDTNLTLPDNFVSLVDVRQYGAKGDGVTDDTAAIQSAIDAAESAGGGQILIPAGTFVIGNLNIPNNNSLVGLGEGVSFLVAKVGTTGNLITCGFYTRISELNISGNSANVTLIYGFKAARSKFDHLYLHDAANGIVLEGVDQANATHAVVLSDISMLTMTGYGIWAKLFSYDGKWSNIWVGSCNVGVRLESGAFQIINLHVWGCTGNGVELISELHQISNLYSESNGARGVVSDHAGRHSKISGGRIWSNTTGGVYITGGSYIELSNLQVDGNTAEGILLNNHTHGVVIGCHCYQSSTDTQSYGIRSTGTSDYLIIVGNDCLDSEHTTTGIALEGTGIYDRVRANITAVNRSEVLIHSVTGQASSVSVDGPAGQSRDLVFRTGTVPRWVLRCEATAEGGGNTGSAFQILARDDAGAALNTAVSITRGTGEVLLTRSLKFNHASGGGYIEFSEQSADPAAPSSNLARFFAKDNGAGKTQLCVRFPTGAVQVIATEP